MTCQNLFIHFFYLIVNENLVLKIFCGVINMWAIIIIMEWLVIQWSDEYLFIPRLETVSNSTICVAAFVAQRLQSCKSLVGLFYTLYDFVIHCCEFCFDCFLVVFAEQRLTRFVIVKFVVSLGLIVFFGFGLMFLQSERNRLRNFWVYSNSGFVRS